MGTIFLAGAFFSSGGDPRENRESVPAPVDPRTPDADWWWDKQAKNMALLRRLGYDGMLLPPMCKSSAGTGPLATGYGLYDHYDLGSKNQRGAIETRFGSRERLQRLIAIAHANGIEVIADIVLHQMSGGSGGRYDYVGAGGQGAGRFSKTPGCFWAASPNQTIPPWCHPDTVPALPNYPFGDPCSYQHSDPTGYMTDGVKEWLDWKISSLDLDGMRMDDTKGLYVDAVNEMRTSGHAGKLWAFNEYFDGGLSVGDRGSLAWYSATQINRSMSQLDFPFHWSCQDVCDGGHSMWRWMPGNSFADFFPYLSVLFVDSPDTDLSPGQQVINTKLMAYARMLLVSQGRPMTYYRDVSSDGGCYGLGREGVDNLVWCSAHLKGGDPVVRHIDADVIGVERLKYHGGPGRLVYISKNPVERPKMFNPTSFGPNVHLHEYTGNCESQGLPGDVWTNGDGWAMTSVPSNVFGAGKSYACWAPAGIVDHDVNTPRATTQTFYGASDLDIAPIGNKTADICRVWCAKGSPLKISLRLANAVPVGGSIIIFGREPDDRGGELFAVGPGEQAGSFEIQAPESGWATIGAAGDGLPDGGMPFKLPVTYHATEGL